MLKMRFLTRFVTFGEDIFFFIFTFSNQNKHIPLSIFSHTKFTQRLFPIKKRRLLLSFCPAVSPGHAPWYHGGATKSTVATTVSNQHPSAK